MLIDVRIDIVLYRLGQSARKGVIQVTGEISVKAVGS
jgi:hypothetical protein